MRRWKLLFGSLLSIWLLGFFSLFSNADTTWSFNVSLLSTASQKSCWALFYISSDDFYLDNVYANSSYPFQSNDSLLLLSGWTQVIWTWIFLSWTQFTFSWLYLPKNYYSVIWVASGEVARTMQRSSNYIVWIAQNFNLLSSNYSSTSVYSTFQVWYYWSVCVFSKYGYTLKSSVSEICQIEVDYWTNSFRSTWKVYIDWWTYTRNWQTITYSWLTGVMIHWTSKANWGYREDFYTKDHLYLSGAYDKTYTGGASNYWTFANDQIACSPVYNFSWYTFTGRSDLQTNQEQVFSWNVFEWFYAQAMKFVVSNYPLIFLLMFGVALVLLILKLLFRRRY